MKKVIVGLAAVGALIALRSTQRKGPTMREHCKETMTSNNCHDEPAETREQAEQEVTQFAGEGEAVAV